MDLNRPRASNKMGVRGWRGNNECAAFFVSLNAIDPCTRTHARARMLDKKGARPCTYALYARRVTTQLDGNEAKVPDSV